MSARRSLSWSAALRDLRDDRIKLPVGFLSTRSSAERYVKYRTLPLVVAGQYDRRAIMQVAALAAKDHQRRYGSTWAEALSVSMKGVWQLAKAARAKAAH